MNSFEITRDKNKTITFEFLLKDSKHNGNVNQIQIIEPDFWSDIFYLIYNFRDKMEENK